MPVPACAPVHCAAGSDGETNFGMTSLAAPHAVSSRVARYSFTARLRPRRIAILVPILTRDRALLVGVGRDQARIDGKAFAANQTGRDARLDDPLEHPAENIAVAEALVAGARERRMIRDQRPRYRACRTSDRRGSPCTSRQINRSERIAKT